MAERNYTDLQLERALAEERELADLTAGDRARLDELRAENAAFLSTVDVASEAKAIARRAARTKPEPKRAVAPWWRWFATAGALAAAAAAILLVVGRRGGGEPDLTTKGDVALVLHSSTRRLATGDTVSPGERIRFEIDAGDPYYVAVIGLDGSGRTAVHFPFGAAASVLVDPRVDRVLPGAIELDATPGDEKFYAVYSRKVFTIQAVIPAIRGVGPLPAGAGMVEVVLHKH